MTPPHEGPKLVVLVSVTCDGCQHLRSERGGIDDGYDYDSGYTHTCANGVKMPGGDSTRTPKGCPFYPTELPKAQWSP